MKKLNKLTLEKAVFISKNIAQVIKNLKRADSSAGRLIVIKYIDEYNISTLHFETHKERFNKNLKNFVRLSNDDIFVEHSTYNSGNNIKNRLYEGGIKERICEKCGQNEIWNGEKMSLILDHKNGVHDDNRIENLRIVCPNCNATLPTHCRGSKKLEKQKKNNDIKIINKIKHNKKLSINQRKVKRPPYKQLSSDISLYGYSATGRKYGVSDNAIRKWVKFYEKYEILL